MEANKHCIEERNVHFGADVVHYETIIILKRPKEKHKDIKMIPIE